MAGSLRRCGSTPAFSRTVLLAACAVMMAACASASYQEAAMAASEAGDQKAATSLAKKEVARFAECSRTTTLNCGTLALAYGTLASYQILDGDRTAGEGSFRGAKKALSLTDPAYRASATAWSIATSPRRSGKWAIGAAPSRSSRKVGTPAQTSICSCPPPPGRLLPSTDRHRRTSKRRTSNRRTDAGS